VDLAFGQSLRRDALLFGETQGRVILSIDPEQEPALRALAERHRLPIYELGKVGGQALVIRDHFAVSSREIESTYRQAIARRMRNS
jgi:phosphoribosylformylglycinamidine synthase